MEKRFYWIKIKESFLTSDTVDFLMSQKDGANYVVLYQMLCLKAINTNGILARMIGDVYIPFDIEKIQRDLKYFNIDTIRIGINLFQKLKLIEINENGALFITNFNNLVGSESASTKRVREYRNRIKQKQITKQERYNVTQNVTQEIDTRDREVDIDTRDISSYKEKNNNKKEKIQSFAGELNIFDLKRIYKLTNDPDIKEVIDLIESNGGNYSVVGLGTENERFIDNNIPLKDLKEQLKAIGKCHE